MNLERPVRMSFWAALVLGGVFGVANMLHLIGTDLPGDYVEGVLLAGQKQVYDGLPLYEKSLWQAPPYRINLYGPVQYKGIAGLARMLGGPPSLRLGRIVSLLALAIALGALWRFERKRLGLSRAEAWVGLLAPLGALPVQVFAAQNRVDTLALALAIVGLVLAQEGRGLARLACLAFVLAVFTKPTAIAAPAALGLSLLLQRRWRDALELTCICTLLGLAGLGYLQISTDGAFAHALFGFNRNPFALGGWIRAMQAALAAPALSLAAGLALDWPQPEADRPASRLASIRLASIYLLLSLGLAIATVGKIGANINYFLEPCLAMGPVLGLAWQRWGGTRTAPRVGLALACCGLLWTGPRLAEELRGRSQRAQIEAGLEALFPAGGQALTLEVASVLRAGAVPYLNDPHIYARLAEAGLWDEAPLLKDIEERRIPVVCLDQELTDAEPPFSNWSRPVRKALRENYRLDRRLGANLYVYLPQPHE